MKQPNITFSIVAFILPARRNILFHNCDPYLINILHVLTSISPNYAMETNKRSVLKIKDSRRFDWIQAERVVTSTRMMTSHPAFFFCLSCTVPTSDLYFSSRSRLSLFCPVVTCLALFCSVLLFCFALFVCCMFLFGLLSTALPQYVKGICVRE